MNICTRARGLILDSHGEKSMACRLVKMQKDVLPRRRVALGAGDEKLVSEARYTYFKARTGVSWSLRLDS